MPTVQSFGALQSFRGRELEAGTTYGGRWLQQALPSTYAAIYTTQPNVRTVVDFIARNIAQLGIHVFRRVSDIDRVRLYDHQLAQWLDDPNPATTRHRLIESLMQDLGIYFNAYWLKVRLKDRIGLVRMPPETVTVAGWLVPEYFEWTQPDYTVKTLSPRDVVYFHGYDPCDPLAGLSPLETLRQTLAEETNAGAYMTAFWNNAARLEGVIQRPATAPKWTPEQKQSFREQWQTRFSGPANAGQTAVLEDGMTFQGTTYSARESEYSTARKLTREEVARAYHVPLPMVGILEHATFSNIREQHKNLYQDCLGPWLDFIQQELKKQLLVECSDRENIYPEFNIAEKLKGSFEEQAASLQSLVGRPVMTLNEGRARLNLPSIKDDPTANQVALPLNMSPSGNRVDPTRAAAAIRTTWERQASRLDKLSAEDRAAKFDLARWDKELAEDLQGLYLEAGATHLQAQRDAMRLARDVNTDTFNRLIAGAEPFANREAEMYVQA